MKTVYFVRHGESESNVNIRSNRGSFQGITSPLTEKGRSQAKFIATRCAKLSFDVILSSNAVRAQETAQEIQRATGKPLEVHEMFVERKSPSRLFGQPRDDQDMKTLVTEWYRTFYENDLRVEDGENFSDLKQRVSSALQYLAERPEPGMVVATHGFFLHMLVGVVLLGEELSVQEFSKMARKVWANNTGLTQLDLFTTEDNKMLDGVPYEGWVLRVWNDHAHLG